MVEDEFGFGNIPVVTFVNVRGRLQKTSGKWGGGGFEILDIPGRGEGGGWFVKVRTSENF